MTHPRDPARWSAGTKGLPALLLESLEEARACAPSEEQLDRMRAGLGAALVVGAGAGATGAGATGAGATGAGATGAGATGAGATGAGATGAGAGSAASGLGLTLAGAKAASTATGAAATGGSVLGASLVKMLAAVLVPGVAAVTGYLLLGGDQEKPPAAVLQSSAPASQPSPGRPATAPTPDGASSTAAAADVQAPNGSQGSGDASRPKGTLPDAEAVKPLTKPRSPAAIESNTLALEAALLQQARSRLATSPAEALALCEKHKKSFASGALVQEREVLAIEALVRLGRTAEAKQRLAGFRGKFSLSPHLPRLESVVSAQQPLKQ